MRNNGDVRYTSLLKCFLCSYEGKVYVSRVGILNQCLKAVFKVNQGNPMRSSERCKQMRHLRKSISNANDTRCSWDFLCKQI